MKNNLITTKTPTLFLMLALFYLVSFGTCKAETYYVSPLGDNANNGLSPTKPLKTITSAVDRAWKSGDIIYVMTGTYVETLYIGQNNLTLTAYHNDKPIINGGAQLPDREWGALIELAGDYNTISGFELKNSNINGQYPGGYGMDVIGQHNTISRMNIHHTWEHGILVHGDYNIVEDSTFWQAALHNSSNVDGKITSGWAAGLSAARDNNNPTALKKNINSYTIFRRNTAYNNWGEGITCYNADHCTMEDNIAYDNWTVNLYLSDATNSLVQRNLVYVSSAPEIPIQDNHLGILLADEAPDAPRASNNRIINNKIYNADFDAYTWSEEAVINPGLKNVLIAGNIIIDGGFDSGGVKEKMVNINTQIKHNYFMGKNNRISDTIGLDFTNNHWANVPDIASTSSSSMIPKLLRVGPTTPGDLTENYFRLYVEYKAPDPIPLKTERVLPPSDNLTRISKIKSKDATQIKVVTSSEQVVIGKNTGNKTESTTRKKITYRFGGNGKKNGNGFAMTTFSDVIHAKPIKADNAQNCRAYSNKVCLLK